MKITKEEFYKAQNAKLDQRTDAQKKFDFNHVTSILSKLQGKK